MLSHLHIKNFTIIDELAIDLTDGMTVVTGETGAGKSIMIDALSLALGQRATAQAIRHGCDRCEISASFSIDKLPAAKQWLSDHDVASDDECLLRRVINKEGPSRSYINGNLCTLQQTSELGQLLVNIHGQHDSQLLLQAEHHRLLLDNFAKHPKLLSDVADLYQQWQDAKLQLKKLLSLEDNQARRELLSYQVQELEQLALQDNELADLEKEHQQLANAQQLIGDCHQVLDQLSSDETSGILNQLHSSLSLLQKFSALDERLKNSSELLNQASINCQEADSELQQFLDQFNTDPERLTWIDQRLAMIYDLARKHKVKASELAPLIKTLSDEYQQLQDSESTIETLQSTIKDLFSRYQLAADKLSKSRSKSATKLAKQVTQYMHQLGMPGGNFTIELSELDKQQAHRFGQEKIEFLVSTNPGQALHRLQKVASGGELSRISLAIQVITTHQEFVPTLLFDEVDVGIGGGTAEIVGQLLRQLGETAQVLCVTHLAQVAALGHHHFKVEKFADKKQTFTKVETLDKDAKVNEIARMLGGVKITKQTLAAAQEMVGT